MLRVLLKAAAPPSRAPRLIAGNDDLEQIATQSDPTSRFCGAGGAPVRRGCVRLKRGESRSAFARRDRHAAGSRDGREKPRCHGRGHASPT